MLLLATTLLSFKINIFKNKIVKLKMLHGIFKIMKNMLYNLNSDPLKNIDYDICVVGSGPAAFASINKITDKRILMLEAGSDEIDALSQEQIWKV